MPRDVVVVVVVKTCLDTSNYFVIILLPPQIDIGSNFLSLQTHDELSYGCDESRFLFEVGLDSKVARLDILNGCHCINRLSSVDK